jgi:hypothetical protein
VKDSLVFAWNGGLEVGEPHYYSIQGPTFLFEMANFQGGANHVHASWRDLKKDFAYDPLRAHARNTRPASKAAETKPRATGVFVSGVGT